MSKAIEIFKDITKIPRPSEKEGKIRDYLVQWSGEKGYTHKTDSLGNLVIYVPATEDKKNNESVILQSHMDMVCVKEEGSDHDFDKDPLDIIIEVNIMRARGTTLGADNGVGVAMAISATEFASHPPLELVFTVDEEQGMSGILGFDFSLLLSKKAINIDTESEREVCISSAGGARIHVKKDIKRNSGAFPVFQIEISGMKGGHSGVEIHKNHYSAINLLLDFLVSYDGKIEIISVDGGVADNVIASGSKAFLGIEDEEYFMASIEEFLEEAKKKYDCPEVRYSVSSKEDEKSVIDGGIGILKIFQEVKIGVRSMSPKIAGLVQTSMNLGIFSTSENIIQVTYLPRSSDMAEFDNLLKDLQEHFKGFDFTIHSRYPGWQDDPEGDLVRLASEEIKKTTGNEPEIIAIHAGLECGALVAGLGDGAHAISIGPNMYDVHSVNEHLELDSVERIEKALEGILSKL